MALKRPPPTGGSRERPRPPAPLASPLPTFPWTVRVPQGSPRMVAEQRESQRMVPAEFPLTAGVQPRTAGVPPESQRLVQVPAESPLTAPEVQLLALPASAPAGPRFRHVVSLFGHCGALSA